MWHTFSWRRVSRLSDHEHQRANEFNSSLTSGIGTFIAGSSQDEQYQELLNVNDGMMGYLIIDKIDVYLPIYHGTSSAVLQKGIGHLEGSYLPTGELGNNTVLTGHTGLPSAELLTYLTDMEVGDTFEVEILNKTFVYQVFNIEVVEPSEIDSLQVIEGKDVVTLVTCTPYGVNSHRLLVQGEQIAVIEADEEADVQAGEKEESVSIWEILPDYTFPVLGLLILILIYCGLVGYIKNKRKQRKNELTEK
ncbi:MAG: class C sortase [Clostridia bacterium]